jgi:hypothetical protein
MNLWSVRIYNDLVNCYSFCAAQNAHETGLRFNGSGQADARIESLSGEAAQRCELSKDVCDYFTKHPNACGQAKHLASLSAKKRCT